MKIHLATVAGGATDVLPHMLAHYRALGVDSFLVNVHLRGPDDPAYFDICRITEEAGCGIASVTTGPWLQDVNPAIYERARAAHPDDWFLLADQDELQEYPCDLRALLEECERKGYDYIEGGFLDRVGPGGGFPQVDPERPIGEQFPLGGFISTPILDANPNKVTAAKGRVGIAPGQHWATSGRGCPAEERYIAVHHYKWSSGICERMQRRARFFRSIGDPWWRESARFANYCGAHGGRIDITDPLLWIAPCSPAYPHWQTVTSLCRRRARLARDPGARLRAGAVSRP